MIERICQSQDILDQLTPIKVNAEEYYQSVERVAKEMQKVRRDFIIKNHKSNLAASKTFFTN